MWHQTTIRLASRPRGFHLVTREVLAAVPELDELQVGLLHLFLQHTSASLAVNENADPDVRADLERWADRAVPEGAAYFEHTAEGPDDMPAHVKGVLFGASLTIPVREGRLLLGTWQGIYLGEHRDQGGSRSVVATLWGEARTARR
jgi:secondary thiamine-phosphate synthase enzyme